MMPSDRRLAGTVILAVAATFALLTLAACGGGGGGTKTMMPSGTGGGTDTGSRTVLDRVPSTVAETAAQSEPRLGSVTQSSNAANGVTLDAGSIDHAANGRLILQVSRESGLSREISTGGNVTLLDESYERLTDDDPLLPNDSVYNVLLRDRADGTVVNIITTRRADLVAGDTVRNWDSNDTDYLAFGSWLRPASSGATQPEVGVYIDGSRPFSASEFTALTGTATYAGSASAFALGDSKAADVAPFLLPSSEGEGRMQLSGAVELTADFGTRAIEGMVTLFGDPDNYDTPGEPQEPEPIVLSLGRAPIDTAQRGGFFVGNTASSGSSSVSGLAGKWGGQFYGAPGDGGRPPYAAGTFGAQRNGFSVLGAFVARDGADVDDFVGGGGSSAEPTDPQPPPG